MSAISKSEADAILAKYFETGQLPEGVTVPEGATYQDEIRAVADKLLADKQQREADVARAEVLLEGHFPADEIATWSEDEKLERAFAEPVPSVELPNTAKNAGQIDQAAIDANREYVQKLEKEAAEKGQRSGYQAPETGLRQWEGS